MKSSPLAILLFLFTISTHYAQVGVGTTNPEARLDIRSSNQNEPNNTDGILIPKINNFPTTNPTAAQDGMMVYVTGSGTPTKGFYYWDQAITNWVLVNNNNSGWSKTGDAGTNSTINFICTTDAQDLSFRTNNAEKMRLTGKGQLEFLNIGNSVFIGEGAGENDDLTDNYNTFVGYQSGNANVTGSYNNFFGWFSGSNNSTGIGNSFYGDDSGLNNTTGNSNSFFGGLSGSNNISGSQNSFFGSGSGTSNTTGNSNSFFGRFAGQFNTTGGFNSFFGRSSGLFNLTGNQNVAIGSFALLNNESGHNNIAIGENALSRNELGSFNVAIGKFAGRGSFISSKSRCVFIGHEAGYNEDNDDRLYIESSHSPNPLIYGEFDNDILGFNASVGIGTQIPTHQLQLSTNSAAKPTSGLWDITSDKRLKKDILPFGDGLETLKQINPVWFTYNGLAEMPIETGVGTIAQDLQEVAPYLIKDWVYTAEDGTTETYLGVNYGPLTFIMVNAIKEQAEEIEQLKLQLEARQNDFDEKMRSLEERISNLEN
ncbi:MAG: tail fiber domain-containing protein [Psychroserpens sp.]|uniref:tail fiber domain-containing protein n=1 Tax=Psychroserpens sp. TaxID=2020870 RepID=UPI003C778E4C